MISIPLTQGKVAIIDDCDAEVATTRWHAARNCRTFYAVHSVDPSTKIMLHRAVWARAHPGEPPPPELDHRNGNGLDCQRANLRPATHYENLRNGRRRSNNSSGFIGVTYCRRNQKWAAAIRFGDQYLWLRYHASAEKAARVRDAIARKIHGAFAILNFPLPGEREAV